MLDVEFAVDCEFESDTFVDVFEGLADDVVEEEAEEPLEREHILDGSQREHILDGSRG
jgi:hypothetical protein